MRILGTWVACAAAILAISTAAAQDYSPASVDPSGENTTIPWRVFAGPARIHASPSSESQSVDAATTGTLLLGVLVEAQPSGEEWLHLSPAEPPRFVSRARLHRVHPGNIIDADLPVGTELVNRWWGLPLEYEPSDLVDIPAEWCGRRSCQLRREAADALVRMLEAARADGIEIRVSSAYRSGPTQVRIYTRNIRNNGINQRSSAPPGHSEHQLGTTVDLVDAARQHTFSRQFDQQLEGAWLMQNAIRFGYVRSYFENNTFLTGYISEPWHWRYWGEHAQAEVARQNDRMKQRASEEHSLPSSP